MAREKVPDMGATWAQTRTIRRDGTKGEGEFPTCGFGIYLDQAFLEWAVLLFWVGGWGDCENNGGYGVNNMDCYNITYRGRTCHSYVKIRGRGDLLEAVGCNYGCVSGIAVVSREVDSIRECFYLLIYLIGFWEETKLYESVCPSELRGGGVLWRRRRQRRKRYLS